MLDANIGLVYWIVSLFQQLVLVIGKQSLEETDEGQRSVGWGMCSLWRSQVEMEAKTTMGTPQGAVAQRHVPTYCQAFNAVAMSTTRSTTRHNSITSCY